MPSFLLPLILCIFTFSLYAAAMDPPSSGSQSQTPITEANLKGWHTRALDEHSDQESFQPQSKNLRLVLLKDLPAKRNIVSLAIFTADIGSGYVVVDAMGRVLNLPSSPSPSSPNRYVSSDIEDLLTLSRETLGPKTRGKIWAIKPHVTSPPIYKLIYISGAEKLQTTVSGYSQDNKNLKLAFQVGDYDTLPDELHELFGLVLETMEGFVGKQVNKEVISKVTKVLSDSKNSPTIT